ncbi:hypothetical protein HY492_02985 [Candidatus Woesearchaeota archaeon]|nr:hypothetical protein [Candidatus Woesearchaeota archaeon]
MELSQLFVRTGIDLCVNPSSGIPEQLIKRLRMQTSDPVVLAALAKEKYHMAMLVEAVQTYHSLPNHEQNRLRTACINIGEQLGWHYLYTHNHYAHKHNET